MFKFLRNYFYTLSCIFQHQYKYYPSISACKFVLLIHSLLQIAFLFPYHKWITKQQDVLFTIMYQFFSCFNTNTILESYTDFGFQIILIIFISLMNILPQILLITCSILYQKNLINFDKVTGIVESIFTVIYNYLALLRWIILIPSQMLSFKFYFNDPLNLFFLFQAIFIQFNILLVTFLWRKIQFASINPLIPIYSKWNFVIITFEIALSIVGTLPRSDYMDFALVALFLMHNFLQLYLIYFCPLEPPLMYFQSNLIVSKLIIALPIIIEIYYKTFQQQIVLFILILIPIAIVINTQLLNNFNFHIQRLNFTNPYINQNHILLNCENLIVYDKMASNDKRFRLHQLLLVKRHFIVCQQERCQRTIKNILVNHSTSKGYKKLTRLIILCQLRTQIDEKKNYKAIDFHQLQIMYIFFLNYVCKTPLLAFLELKDYQSHGDVFFYFILNKLNQRIAHYIVASQLDLEDLINQVEIQEKQIEIKDINKGITLEKEFVPKILNLIMLKHSYYVKAQNGYDNLNTHLNDILDLNQKIINLGDDLIKTIGIDLNQRNWEMQAHFMVLQFRVLSVYYSFILADYEKTLRIENFIDAILTQEKTQAPDKIFNLSIIEDSAVVLQTSIFKNRGYLQHINRRQVAKFFGYENELDFTQIIHIHQIMPDFMAQIHDGFMNHYMEHGKTTRFTLGTIIFIKTKFNYLECIKLKLDNFFHVTDDYVLSASLIKTNTNTNYILFDQTGRIQGITKPLFDFFMPKIMKNFNVHNQELVQKFINYAYIFFFMPQVFYLIDQQKQQYLDVQNEENLEEKRILISIPKNLNRLMEMFNDFREDLNQKFKPQDTSFVSLQRINSIYSRLSTGRVKKLRKHNNLTTKYIEFNQHGFNTETCNILLYDEEYRSNIRDFFDVLEVENIIEESFTFYVRGVLHLKIMGHDSLCTPYFSLEIWDFKEKNMDWMNQRMISFYQEVLLHEVHQKEQKDKFFAGIFGTENVTAFSGNKTLNYTSDKDKQSSISQDQVEANDIQSVSEIEQEQEQEQQDNCKII